MKNKVVTHYKIFIIGYIILSIVSGLLIFNPHWLSRDIFVMIFILSIGGGIGMSLNLAEFKRKNGL